VDESHAQALSKPETFVVESEVGIAVRRRVVASLRIAHVVPGWVTQSKVLYNRVPS